MISFSVPSRGRPKLAARLVNSARSTANNDVEILFYLNSDDPTLQEYQDLLSSEDYVIGPNQSTCLSWNQMADRAKHDIVMLMGDDVQIQTAGWDSMIADQINKYKSKILMVVPSDGRKKGSGQHEMTEPLLWHDAPLGAAHFAVHKNWINTLGYLAPPFFWHFWVDEYTQKVARKINRCMFMPNVIFKAKKIFDTTATQVRSNLNIAERDKATWHKVKVRHLNSDVQCLKKFIEND
jgi:glycosyltransferase involved in cell wall biosynthesis